MSLYQMQRSNREFFYNYKHVTGKRPLRNLFVKELEIAFQRGGMK